MRSIATALALAGLVACGSSSEMPREEVDWSEGVEFEVDPETYERPDIGELGTDRTRPIAKTIEWPGFSTQPGTAYHGGGVVVDKIFREDADGNYGVRIRLKNTTEHVLALEYQIRFYNRQGGALAGWLGHNMAEPRWTAFVIEPFKTANIGDFCRVMGAEGFLLFVRGAGSDLGGRPYVPEADQ